MKIYKLIVGPIQSNCYIIETKNKNGVIIDAGDEAEKIIEFYERKGITIKKILITHGHFDHIGAVSAIVAKTGAHVYIHPSDAAKLQSPEKSLATIIPDHKFNKVTKYEPIFEGDTITVDELTFKVMHTPGHSKGSVCYILDDIIFSGDTIFCGSVGRTDFPDGDLDEIVSSAKRIAKLKGDYTIYCGHEKSTTLDYERKNNAYMREE